MIKNKPGTFNNYRNREFTNAGEKYTNLVMDRIHNAAMEYSLEEEDPENFDAICISGVRTEDNDGTQVDFNDSAVFGRVQYIKIKPKTPYGNQVPDLSSMDNPAEINFIISTLDERFTAQSDFLFSSMDSIEFGQIVKCRRISSMDRSRS